MGGRKWEWRDAGVTLWELEEIEKKKNEEEEMGGFGRVGVRKGIEEKKWSKEMRARVGALGKETEK